MAGSREHYSCTSGAINGGEFLGQLSDSELLKESVYKLHIVSIYAE